MRIIPKMKSRKQNEMVKLDIRSEASLLVDRSPDHDSSLSGNDDHGQSKCREILPGKTGAEDKTENKPGKNQVQESDSKKKTINR